MFSSCKLDSRIIIIGGQRKCTANFSPIYVPLQLMWEWMIDHEIRTYNMREWIYLNTISHSWAMPAVLYRKPADHSRPNPHTSFTHPPIKVDWVHRPPVADGPSEALSCSWLQSYNHQGKEECLTRHRSECHGSDPTLLQTQSLLGWAWSNWILLQDGAYL